MFSHSPCEQTGVSSYIYDLVFPYQFSFLHFSVSGNEFKSSFARALRERGIKLQQTRSLQKASFAESAIRRLRNKFQRYATYSGDVNFRKNLDRTVAAVNRTPLARTGLAPNTFTQAQAGLWYKKKYEKTPDTPVVNEQEFPVGTPVRIRITKDLFQKVFLF